MWLEHPESMSHWFRLDTSLESGSCCCRRAVEAEWARTSGVWTRAMDAKFTRTFGRDEGTVKVVCACS